MVSRRRLAPGMVFLAPVFLFAGLAAFAQIPPQAAAQPGRASTLDVSSPNGARAVHGAQILLSGTQLEIRADNSSLNAILRDLAQRTGMQITGGVVDQRVFGNYGPAPADQVLSELLEGTGTNMLLRQTSSGGLGELILSPRVGGPTLPGPTAFHEDAQAIPATPPAAASAPAIHPAQQAPAVPPLPFSRPAMPPAATDPMQTPTTPDPQGIVEPPLYAPATEPGTTPGPTTQHTGLSDTTSGRASPATPDTAKTPQQIYEELQKLQQQQNQ